MHSPPHRPAHDSTGDPARPSVLLLDVNETLSDLTPLEEVLTELGAPSVLAQAWLASVLRDGFALACAGTAAPFADIARDVSRRLLAPYIGGHGVGGTRVEDAATRVLGAFGTLGVHDDVPTGLRSIAGHGIRLVTLSNGAAAVAQGLLERAGLDDVVERTLSVEGAGVWKPAPASYLWACGQIGVDPAQVMLAAVHPWDTDGAARAGLSSAWIDRSGADLGFPEHFTAPTHQVAGLVELASALDPSPSEPPH